MDCIVNSYSNFTVNEDKKMRGRETVNENMADIGAVKAAFYAYKNYLKENGLKNEYRLPGLQEYDHEQLFWIFYANVSCFLSILNL